MIRKAATTHPQIMLTGPPYGYEFSGGTLDACGMRTML